MNDTRMRNDDGELMYIKDRDQICQATFKDHCQYPKCDCDRPVLDPIQNNCVYGFVLPDRCRYTAHLGCECGAYPPLKWDGEKYISPREVVHQ